MKKKRKCSVCGDLVQSNVKLLWKSDNDGVVFHVCMLCAEEGKINAHNVNMKSMKSYTTYLENGEPYIIPHLVNNRGKRAIKK